MTEDGIYPALLDTWRSARLWVDVPSSGGVEIIPADDADPARWSAATEAVHLLSAWNPGGEALEQRVNETRSEELLHALEVAGIERWAAAGYSADHSWIEHGFALPNAGRLRTIQLAGRFGQLAIYEWTPTELSIVECTSGLVTARYGWSIRPLASAPAAST